jgi:hypothetical protein
MPFPDAVAAPPQPRPQAFFKRRTIIIARRFRMAWPWLLDRITNGDQSVPPALIVDGSDPVKLGKAARDLRSRPKATVIRRRLEPLLKRRQRIGCEDRRLCSIAAALIAERLRTALVVAFEQRPHPARRERQQLRDLVELISAPQQPEGMKMALADRIDRRLITRLKLSPAQVCLDHRHDRSLQPNHDDAA